MIMNGSISHDRQEETQEAKAWWFQSSPLPLTERMKMLVAFTVLALSINLTSGIKKVLNRLMDVFKSFLQHDVKYVVIGGIASILYGTLSSAFFIPRSV